jgi:hypothetical protein
MELESIESGINVIMEGEAYSRINIRFQFHYSRRADHLRRGYGPFYSKLTTMLLSYAFLVVWNFPIIFIAVGKFRLTLS